MRLLLSIVLLGAILTACFEDAVQAGGDDPSHDSGVQRDARITESDASRVVSSDPEGTGATLTASKSQVCPGECVELLATPGEGVGAVSYRWANELAEGAGPVQVCPQVDTTYEVAIRHEEGTVGEFVTEASELSRSVTVTLGGDCQPEAQPPEIHESAREICRVSIPVSAGFVDSESYGLMPASTWYGPALVHLLPSGGVRVAGTYRGRLAPGTFTLDATDMAGFVIDLDADCQPTSAVQLVPQAGASLSVSALAVDARGDSIVSGNLHGGSYDLGNGPVGVGDPETRGYGWAVLAKLDPAGRALWSKSLKRISQPSDLRVDAAGNIVLVAHSFSDQFAIDLGSGPVAIEPGHSLLAKFDRDGNHLWSRTLLWDAARIDVAPDGQIAAVSFHATEPLSEIEQPTFVRAALYDPDGNELWRSDQHLDNVWPLWFVSQNVALGPDHRVVVRTEYERGRSDEVTPPSRVLTMAFDGAGATLWRHEEAAVEHRYFWGYTALSVDRWGSAASASTFHGALEIGASTLQCAAEHDDVYVSLLDASGRERWGFALGETAEPFLAGLDSDEAGNLAVATSTGRGKSALVVVKLAQ